MKRPSGFTPQRPAEPPAGGRAGRVEDDVRAEVHPIPLFARETKDPVEPRPASEAPRESNAGGVRQARKLRKRVEKAEVRRFTASSRRLRRNWLVGVGTVVVLALTAVLAAYTPLLSVREIQVEGAFLVSSDAVVNDLSSQLGSPFPLVDDTAIKAALVQYPLIESYSVQARPPSTLIVRLVERTPVGALASASGFTVVDAAGVTIAESATRPANYPLIAIEGGTEAEGFQPAAAALRSVPDDLLATIDQVTATTQDDVTFTLRDSETRVVWGSPEESKLKAYTLTKLMASQPGFEVYDVSSPSVAVVR